MDEQDKPKYAAELRFTLNTSDSDVAEEMLNTFQDLIQPYLAEIGGYWVDASKYSY
jgi:hypothetical protein